MSAEYDKLLIFMAYPIMDYLKMVALTVVFGIDQGTPNA